MEEIKDRDCKRYSSSLQEDVVELNINGEKLKHDMYLHVMTELNNFLNNLDLNEYIVE